LILSLAPAYAPSAYPPRSPLNLRPLSRALNSAASQSTLNCYSAALLAALIALSHQRRLAFPDEVRQ
jgi:hypothetical protein